MLQICPTPFVINHNTNINWHMDKYHFHEFCEINLSLSEGAKFFVANQVYSVKPGSLFVFNSTDLHRSVSPPDIAYERYVIYFNPDFIRHLSTPRTNLLDCFINRQPQFSHCRELSPLQRERLLALIRNAQTRLHSTGYGHDISRTLALAEVLLYVNELYRSTTLSEPVENDKELQRVLPVLIYIQTNLAGDLRLDHLAAAFYINKYYLSTIFKKSTGFSITEYIIYRRILRARELLKGNLTVQRAGESVGFNDNSHFIRTFKKLVGISPKQYQLRENNH